MWVLIVVEVCSVMLFGYAGYLLGSHKEQSRREAVVTKAYNEGFSEGREWAASEYAWAETQITEIKEDVADIYNRMHLGHA